MTAALQWFEVAVAVASWPGGTHSRIAHSARQHRTPSKPRGLPTLAATSVAALCLALFGAVPGIPISCAAVPVVAVLVLRSGARQRDRPGGTGLPFALDLAAAVLRSGAPVSMALEQAAPAAGDELGPTLLHAARLLRLGAGPAEAWRLLADDRRLATLAAVSRRSATSGIRLAAAWEQLASELRAERRACALGRAHRAGSSRWPRSVCAFCPLSYVSV